MKSKRKESYSTFTKDNYVPLFFRDYYLDVVCNGNWDVVLYKENNKILGAYIYMLKQKFLLKYIVQPQLCPYTGPLIFDASKAKSIYSFLLNKLPSHDLIIQDYFFIMPDISGIENTRLNKHTYLLDKRIDIDDLWAQQSSTHRRIIRKAERELQYFEETEIDLFLDYVNRTFSNRNKQVPNDPKIFKALDHELVKRNQRKIVKCIDANNKIVAMCYLMNDERWTYNFANSVIEDYRHYGMNLIIWNEIKASFEKGIFPFQKESQLFGFTIQTFNIFIGIVLIPLNLIIAFGPTSVAMPLIYIGVVIIGILALIRTFRGFLIASTYIQSNLFHFLLYLCTFEILPILLLIKIVGNLEIA